MKEMTVSEAVKLVKAQTAPAISIYLKTDHRDRDSMSKMRTNLARLYKTVEAMITRTYDVRTKNRLLEPLKKALDGLRLSPSRGGIAIYHNENFTGVARVPTPVSDLAVAAESFHLKPMLRCVQLRRNYYVLALRKRCADLYLVSPDGTKKIDRIELAQKRENLTSENERDEPRRWFKNGFKIRRQKDLHELMSVLNRQLTSRWQGERLPLVLAGKHQEQEAFRKSCSYAYVLERGLVGDIEYMDEKALSGLASHIMEQHFSDIDDQAVVSFRKAEAAGLASSHLVEIAAAAARGQVQSLLIAEDHHIWGHLDRDSGTVEVLKEKQDATSDDLLDDIAELTLLKGGKVTVLPSFQMPKGRSIAAVLRWNHAPEENQMPAFVASKERFSALEKTA